MTPLAGQPREQIALRNELASLVRTQALDPFARDRSPANLSALVSAVYAALTLFGDRIDRQYPNRRPFACKAGCWLCCNAVIVAEPIYCIFAALHAKSTLPAATFAAVGRRVFERRTPCPLLVDGQCSIYAGRPPICRYYFSYSLDLCRTNQYCRDDPAYPREQAINVTRALFSIELLGMVNRELSELGLATGEHWLDATLRILFTVPDAIDRWLAGEDVFREAKRTVG